MDEACLIVILFVHKLLNYFLNSCELFSSMITRGNELHRMHRVKNYFLLLEPVLELSFHFCITDSE